MLPEVTFKSVSRDDVDRIAWWLQDDDLTSRWFGHYSADDPVHPGYDPSHMLEASDWEWRRTFGDPRRAIFSIYNTADEHVGECQVQHDGEGGAELTVIIGRKDLWHHGYGTATMLELLDKVFNTIGLDAAWVTVSGRQPARDRAVREAGIRDRQRRPRQARRDRRRPHDRLLGPLLRKGLSRPQRAGTHFGGGDRGTARKRKRGTGTGDRSTSRQRVHR